MPIVSSQVWIPFLSLVGGGLAGAILTGIFANVRARKQPVGYAKEMTTVFKSSEGLPNTYIAVKDGEDEGKFNNLFIVNVVVVNKGNRDMDRFTLGLTSYEDDIFVRVNPKTPDRHHVAKYEPDVSLLQPTTQVDFTLEPFNRQDAYVLECLVVASANRAEPGEIKISTREPVQFVSILSLLEAVEGLASGPLGELALHVPFGAVGVSIARTLTRKR